MRALRALLLALLAALTVGGCTESSSSGSASPSRSASPSTSSGSADATPVVPAPPMKAACYRLTSAELTRPTNDSRPVPCTRRHTARTIFVGKLDTVVDGHSVAVDSARVQKQLSTACPRKMAAFLGGSETTRNLSRFNVVWYSPTLEQSDQGADWFRCDLIAFDRTDTLFPLPRKGGLKGVLDRPDALETYGLCGTTRVGAPGYQRVICDRKHAWRAIDAIGIPGGRKYPPVAKLRAAGEDACADQARSRADDTLKFTYTWEWPTAEQWLAGQHYGFCWTSA